ncbi:hypothetical protein [Aquimarina algiphila]|uniref:Lipoprotein n=1 Tax=Aquimarina algiphila TaxID=2047982 RepID=A0A554VFC1_9FLAO|nr:hypothetical protein [Aquimarina algiphila]TSE05822.1 hypothetical protein FOF46_21535 [Aquimarina algiphila]
MKFLKLLFITLIIISCSAQQEEEIDPLLEEINLSECNYNFVKDTQIVKSDLKFLSSTQIFDDNGKQGVVSIYFELEFNEENYKINFHTESNIFDNYLGFRDADISNHEVVISFYFEGVEKTIIGIANKVDLIESKNLIKPDSFMGYTFSIENVGYDLLDSLRDKKLIKFSIHEDMYGIYSSYRKDISKEIKCITYAIEN